MSSNCINLRRGSDTMMMKWEGTRTPARPPTADCPLIDCILMLFTHHSLHCSNTATELNITTTWVGEFYCEIIMSRQGNCRSLKGEPVRSPLPLCPLLLYCPFFTLLVHRSRRSHDSPGHYVEGLRSRGSVESPLNELNNNNIINCPRW